jgi:hypothetical protein
VSASAAASAADEQLTGAEREHLEALALRLRISTLLALVAGLDAHAVNLLEHARRCDEVLQGSGGRCWS